MARAVHLRPRPGAFGPFRGHSAPSGGIGPRPGAFGPVLGHWAPAGDLRPRPGAFGPGRGPIFVGICVYLYFLQMRFVDFSAFFFYFLGRSSKTVILTYQVFVSDFV